MAGAAHPHEPTGGRFPAILAFGAAARPVPPANWFVDHWQQRHARGSTTHKNVMTAHKQVDLVKKIKAIVSGNIQNVGYRAKVIAFARAFELAGFVQNLDDGRVKIIAEGEEDTYPLQIKW